MNRMRLEQISTEIIAEQEKQIQHLQIIILITIIICGFFILAICILILKRMERNPVFQNPPPPLQRIGNSEIKINEN